MIYLAYFIFLFSVIQLSVAIVNLIFGQRLYKPKNGFTGLVSVLIPARNEEKNIRNIIKDLQQQDYQNIEIIIFNDQSTDKTTDILSELVKNDERIRLINSDGLPEGWLGKNYACHSLSNVAKGEYFLFLDADVRIKKDIIIRTIEHMRRHSLGLLSIFPKQIMHSIGEWISIPNMNYILLSLLPLIMVRKSGRASLSAANGQFMLFEASKVLQYLPHKKMKTEKVEDIEIARYFKRNKIPVACLAGNNNISCRMYHNFNEAVNGFSKNVTTFFGNSFVLAIFFWLITTFGFIPIVTSLSNPEIIIYLAGIILTRLFITIVSKQSIFKNLLLLVLQQITIGLFIYKAIINTLKKQYQWKGRNISY